MRAKKIDVNQPALVKQLRQCGFSVAITSQLGCGFPDLVISRNGKNMLVEIKDPSQPPSKRKLTPDEEKFHNAWQGSIIVAMNVEEVINEFQKL